VACIRLRARTCATEYAAAFFRQPLPAPHGPAGSLLPWQLSLPRFNAFLPGLFSLPVKIFEVLYHIFRMMLKKGF
jgi:hypothetical protein